MGLALLAGVFMPADRTPITVSDQMKVDSLCELLGRSQLLSTDEVQRVRQQWLQESGAGDSLEQFSRWLVTRKYATEYQVAMLVHGHTGPFFLDNYKLLERIGKGRMAVVYKAVHRLGQVVAIKVLPPTRARDPLQLARFQREVRLGWRLHHPNIVRTFQTGEAHGLHYVVMEYLQGETLERTLQRRGRLPVVEAVRLSYQILLGLQHIHDMGLVHRNLEPANLFLVKAAGTANVDSTLQTTVKILDISLGRALFDQGNPARPANTRLTFEGVLLGIPDYMAPEQARDAHASDIRADIYSLGCVLYHTLTGQTPFPDANPLRQVIQHATEMPRPLNDFDAEIPDGLQQIMDRMLAKDPARRFPTPERAAQALEAFLHTTEETVHAPGDEAHLEPYLKWLEAADRDELPQEPALETGPAARSAAASATVSEARPISNDGIELVPVSMKGQTANWQRLRPSRRDYVAMVIGAAGLLGAEAIGLLVGQKLRGRIHDPDDNSDSQSPQNTTQDNQ
jgi:serine/threonine protein kinase